MRKMNVEHQKFQTEIYKALEIMREDFKSQKSWFKMIEDLISEHKTK